MLDKISGKIIQLRWVIIAVWIGIALLIFFRAPLLSEVAKGDQASFLPPNSSVMKAADMIKMLYPNKGEGSSFVLTLERQAGLSDTDKEFAKKLEEYLIKAADQYHIREIISPFSQEKFSEIMISKNGKAAYMVANLNVPSYKDITNEVIKSVRELVRQKGAENYASGLAVPDGLVMNVTGDAALGQETMENVHDSMNLTTKITLILVLVVLIIIYRSPVAPLVPLLTVGVSFIISRGLVAILTTYGLKVSSFTETFMMAVLFGAGTDYCLLLASRFREEIVAGKLPREALKATMPKTGIAIVSSGATVIVGFFAMILAKFGLYSTTGPSIAIGVGISILAVITLTPAVISVLGEFIFWPAHPSKRIEQEREGSRFWNKLSGTVTRRPVRFILICLVVFTPFLFSTIHINRSFDQLAELPSKSDAVKGFDVIKENFNQGEMLPVKVVLKDKGDMWSMDSLQVVDDIAKSILKVEGVVRVRTATRPKGEPISQLYNGLDAVNQGSKAIAEGISQGSVEMNKLTAGTQTAVDGITALREGIKASNSQIQGLATSATDFKKKLQALSKGLLDTKTAVDNGNKLLDGAVTGFTGITKTNPQLLKDKNYLSAMKMLTGAQTYGAGSSSGLGEILKQLETAGILLDETQKSASTSAEDMTRLDGILSGLQSGLIRIRDGQSQTVDGLKAATTNLVKISAGISQVQEIGGPSPRADNSLNSIFYLPKGAIEANPQLKEGMGYFISPDGKGINIEVVLSIPPYSKEALDCSNEVRKAVGFTLKNTKLQNAEFYVTGSTAAISELRDITAEDFVKVIAFVLLGIFIVLVILLRSLIAPIYLIFTIILSYATTMGITYLVFQKLLGYDGLTWSVPFFSFCILVALGVDYNIFLMTRVKEEYRPGDVTGGIQRALASTGKIITSCGIIMAGTFGALLASPVTQMVEIGFTAVVGLLLDTFIIRCLLVPALAVKVGEMNWWPGRKIKVVACEKDVMNTQESQLNV